MLQADKTFKVDRNYQEDRMRGEECSPGEGFVDPQMPLDIVRYNFRKL